MPLRPLRLLALLFSVLVAALTAQAQFVEGTAPSAPTNVTATPGDGIAIVSWDVPASEGSGPIQKYGITINPGGIPSPFDIPRIVPAEPRRIVVDGLANGTAYTFTVTAANGFLYPPTSRNPSAPSNSVTPVPSAPTPATAITTTSATLRATIQPNYSSASAFYSTIPGFAELVTFQYGYLTGPFNVFDQSNFTILGTVTANPSRLPGRITETQVSAQITGLSPNTLYYFRVRTAQELNIAGQEKYSTLGSFTTAQTATAPDAPTGVVATAGNGQVTLAFSAPSSDGGSPITGYTATSSDGGITASSVGAFPYITVPGLANDIRYTFTVTATNGVGIGAPSSPSNAVTLLGAPGLSGISPSIGLAAGGTFVTITGSNFGNNPSVAFDGVPATSVTVVNSTTITAVTPAHPVGPVFVSISTPSGTVIGGGVIVVGGVNFYTYIAAYDPPAVIDPNATGVTGTAAIFGGTVDSDGYSAITARGIVLSPTATNANPQLGGTGVINLPVPGTLGAFTIPASGLLLHTSYTYAAYATNSVGTTYSATATFTTSAIEALLDTTQADFEAGTSTSLSTATPPGDVTLAGPTIVQQNTATSSSNLIRTTTWGAQSFTPSLSGPLLGAAVQLEAVNVTGTTPNLILSLRATDGLGVPTGAVLASATIPGFNSPTPTFYSAFFATPPVLVAGTQYVLLVRPSQNPSAGGRYYLSCSTSDTYAGGNNLIGSNSGTSWSPQTSEDIGFAIYMNPGYVASGDLVSSLKDSALAAGTTHWTTLSWTASVPASTTLRFQVAASPSASGPFAFVGPDGTAATFFITSGASLDRFYGNRYLKYRAYLTSTNPAVSPTLSDVTVAYDDVPVAPTPVPTVTGISPAGGSIAGGTSVTITGTNFTGATAVTFGGTAATHVTVLDATSLTATTPAHAAGPASVLVTTPGGSNPANTLFTYAVVPTLTLDHPSISAPEGSTVGNSGLFDGQAGSTLVVTASTGTVVQNSVGEWTFQSAIALDGNTGDPKVDAAGNLYVNNASGYVTKITPAGVQSNFVLGFQPGGILVDSTANILYATALAENGGSDHAGYVYCFQLETGDYLFRFGGPGTDDGQFTEASCLAQDSNGNLYVADSASNRIQVFASDGTFLSTWGGPGSGNGQFNGACSMQISGTTLYVVDRFNHRVQKFTTEGVYLGQWGSGGSDDGQFNQPVALDIDPVGNVFVCDLINNRVQKFTADGVFLDKFGPGAGEGALSFPDGIIFGGGGRDIYITNYLTHNVVKYTAPNSWSWTAPALDGPATTLVTLTATDTALGLSGQVSFPLVVTNVAPTLALSGPATVSRGSAYILTLGTITDPGIDTVTAYSINWGDGVTEHFTGAPGGTRSHTYATTGGKTIRVSLTDEDGTFANAGTRTVAVVLPPPVISSIAPASGGVAGGTSVVITGANFSGAGSVLIGGAAVQSFTVDSSTQITATTAPRPLGAGVVDVSVISSAGTGVGAGLFTYVESAYAVWALANGAGSNPAADTDGDGLTDLQEFAFGTNSANGASGSGSLRYTGTLAGGGTIGAAGQPMLMLETVGNATNAHGLFCRRKDYAAAGLVYTAQFSADLVTWVDGTTAPTVLADDGTTQIVSVPFPTLAGGKRFFRVRLILN